MHLGPDFLAGLAVVLGVAAVTTVLFQRLRQPVVLGYVLAGLIVGPHVPLPLVADPKVVSTLSELGVVLLMFSLGLEFTGNSSLIPCSMGSLKWNENTCMCGRSTLHIARNEIVRQDA